MAFLCHGNHLRLFQDDLNRETTVSQDDLNREMTVSRGDRKPKEQEQEIFIRPKNNKTEYSTQKPYNILHLCRHKKTKW